MLHMLCREVAIHDECSDKLVPARQQFVGHISIAQSGDITYGWYFVFQSFGRFTPGCGQAGKNTAIEPSGMLSSGRCPSPCSILFLRSRHWREALNSCL